MNSYFMEEKETLKCETTVSISIPCHDSSKEKKTIHVMLRIDCLSMWDFSAILFVSSFWSGQCICAQL